MFTPQEIERQKDKHAKRRLPNFSFSRSLNFDPWEAIQYRKNFLNGKKYNLDTPLFVLKEALMKDRQRKGFNPKFVQPKVEAKIQLAMNDTKELQDILDYLNSEECVRSMEDT